MKFLFTLTCCLGLAGIAACAEDDDSMYLTGTEEFAIRNANGQLVCPSPEKVLLCHIPPGNPDNAHSICVSTHAVAPHQAHHGDPIGVCLGGGDPPPDDPPPSDPPPPPSDQPPPIE